MKVRINMYHWQMLQS